MNQDLQDFEDDRERRLTYRKSSSEVYIKWFKSKENTPIKRFKNFTL